MQTKSTATRYSKEFRESMISLSQTGRSANSLSKEYKGCLFTLITNNVQSVGTPIKGTGGYNWSKVVLKNSGAIWLSVANKNNLLYGTK